MPDDKANYLHRIGRVGRAKKMGLAISLVSTVKVNFFFIWNPILISIIEIMRIFLRLELFLGKSLVS